MFDKKELLAKIEINRGLPAGSLKMRGIEILDASGEVVATEMHATLEVINAVFTGVYNA